MGCGHGVPVVPHCGFPVGIGHTIGVDLGLELVGDGPAAHGS